MTDRELLELAAKAAGIPVRDLDSRYDCWEETHPFLIHKGWNPLDGDALRLAVTLRLVIQHGMRYVVAMEIADDRNVHHEDNKGDPYAATRRAIVRAAAEIGRMTR